MSVWADGRRNLIYKRHGVYNTSKSTPASHIAHHSWWLYSHKSRSLWHPATPCHWQQTSTTRPTGFPLRLTSPYQYNWQYMTLVAGLLSRGQGPEGPATGHLDTGFSWFPCVHEQMLSWFPRCQVATTCFSCSPPPDLNLVVNPVYM